jgi:para-aminobenzoate synthetase/4-amino-4-deoxychorismate lyase
LDSEVDPSDYGEQVRRIKRLIEEGETYQVNHTFRLQAAVVGDLVSLYEDLAAAQFCSYGAFIDTGRHSVLSVSPELFFRWRGDRIWTRPMKGTIARGRYPAEDARQLRGLQASDKDRAENLMIVDLLRNDLGRLAEFGSVTVDDLFTAERYETVWQLTSSVSARTRPGTGLVDVFRALFPSGSVTGAPKAATMRIIAELERSPRGVYCGAIGSLAPRAGGDRNAEFSVAIRTLLVDKSSGLATYGVGGGITYDSTSRGELEEALLKARVLSVRRPEFMLVETLRREPDGTYPRLPRHLARLGASADYFGFRCSLPEVSSRLQAVGGDSVQRVRVRLGRSGAIEVDVSAVPSTVGPVRLAIDNVAIDPSDPLLYHKTTIRTPYEEARRRHPEADDVVLVDLEGHATETTIANLAALVGGAWVTPPLDCGCLPGTLRAQLLEEGRLQERSLPLDVLAAADQVAVLNSLRGWRPAVLI